MINVLGMNEIDPIKSTQNVEYKIHALYRINFKTSYCIFQNILMGHTY